MKTLYYFIVFLLISQSSISQITLEVDKMKQDFLEFRETLENEHCCIYEFTDKETFDSLFDQQYQLIDQPLPLNEFYKIMTPITATIGCGHTAIWMPGSYWDMNPENLFPLQIKLMDDLMVVSGSYNETDQIPVGSIIKEINGRSVNAIIEEMRANYSADANNIYFINSQIERRFPLIYSRRFGFPDKYIIKFSLPESILDEEKILIPTSNKAVREVIFKNFNHPPLTFDQNEEKNTAILTIPTFIYYDDVTYFVNFIDSCFTVIKSEQIEDLILDIRGNDGGDPFCAAPLFCYFQKLPVPYFSQPYGKYSDLSEPLPMPENHFNGNLYTLMDGRCFSTNAHFCSLLKYHKIGVFIGTPSGGTYSCNAGKNGNKRLENSGIQLYFARSSFSTAVEGMDKSKPIYPDYMIEDTYSSFLLDEDIQMNKALELIEKTNIK